MKLIIIITAFNRIVEYIVFDNGFKELIKLLFIAVVMYFNTPNVILNY